MMMRTAKESPLHAPSATSQAVIDGMDSRLSRDQKQFMETFAERGAFAVACTTLGVNLQSQSHTVAVARHLIGRPAVTAGDWTDALMELRRQEEVFNDKRALLLSLQSQAKQCTMDTEEGF